MNPQNMVLIISSKTMKIKLSFLIMLTFLIIPSTSAPYPEFRNCDNSAGNFTENSSFNESLSNALSSLTSISSSKTFSNVTVGSIESDRVYAYFSCQHDLPLQICHSCVQNATEVILSRCYLNPKEAIVIYEECTLRYANRMIFNTMELEPYDEDCSFLKYPAQQVEIGNVVKSKFDELITQATNSADYFSVGRVNNLANNDLYFLVQCVTYITKEECNDCLSFSLNISIKSCASDGALGGHIMGPSCYIRYDVEPFFYTEIIPTVLPPNPSPGTPPATTTTSNTNDRRARSTIKGVILILFICVIIIYILIKIIKALCRRCWK